MAAICDNASFCTNRKRCFLLLLVINLGIAIIYFAYDFHQSSFQHSTSIVRNHFPSPIQHLRALLEHDYDLRDLDKFYQFVDEEFTLGLRCMRKPKSNSSVSEPNRRSNRRRRWQLYNFILNHTDACANETIDLLIIIISKSENYKTRDAIRRTWGSGKNLGSYSWIQIRFFFLIDFDEKLISQIRLENNIFNDIIQVELPQQYTLVTHRVLALFEWSFRYCRTAKFLFKTDDDIFVNMYLLLKFLAPMLQKNETNPTNRTRSFRISDMTIYGYKHSRPGVFRHANDPVGARYVITTDEYPCSYYPDFLSGFGYLIPKKARDALVYASYHDQDAPFRISDVYLTGILPDYLSLSRQSMSNYGIRYQGNCDNYFTGAQAFACAAGLHHGQSTDVFALFNRYWQEVRQKV